MLQDIDPLLILVIILLVLGQSLCLPDLVTV